MALMAVSRIKAEEVFQQFLFEMDDRLEWLYNVASGYGIPLNETYRDVSLLETLYDTLIVTELFQGDREGLVILLARQLGEVLRRNYGAKWALCLNDERNPYYNTPVLFDLGPHKDLEFSPIFTVRAYAVRRKQGTILRAVEAQVNPTPLSLDHLLED